MSNNQSIHIQKLHTNNIKRTYLLEWRTISVASFYIVEFRYDDTGDNEVFVNDVSVSYKTPIAVSKERIKACVYVYLDKMDNKEAIKEVELKSRKSW